MIASLQHQYRVCGESSAAHPEYVGKLQFQYAQLMGICPRLLSAFSRDSMHPQLIGTWLQMRGSRRASLRFHRAAQKLVVA